MNRREAIKRLSLLMGGAVIGAETFLSGGVLAGKRTTYTPTPDELALLDEIGETIIPATASPGAKAVGIGAFMRMMANDCYDDAHQAVFATAAGRTDSAAKEKFGKGFLHCSAAERTSLLNGLDKEARQHPAGGPVHYFLLLKQLTLLGYFTSETGCTQALRYVETPGAFRGNEPYKRGDRAWFVPPGRNL